MSNRNPKVLFFFHTNELGGAEKSALTIIQECSAKGFSVEAVVPSNGALKEELTKLTTKVSVVNYRWWCSVNSNVTWYRYWEMLFSFWNILLFWITNLRSRPDVVVTNTLTIPWGIVYSKLAGRPHIQLIREFGSLDFGFHFILGYTLSMHILGACSHYVFTNSLTMSEFYKSYIDAQKLDYMYPTIFKSCVSKARIGRNYFRSKKSLKLLVLGTIIEAKGQLEAVRALTHLAKLGYTDIELILAGKRNSEEYSHQILAESVSNLDALRNITILEHLVNPFKLLREADVVLICSKNEAFGRIAAEAMLFNKAIIASDSGANREILADGRCGLLYIPGDTEDLAAKIKALHDDRNALQQLGEKAFDNYVQKLQPKMNAKPLISSVMQLANAQFSAN